MLNYVGIKKNSGFILYVGLTSQADVKLLQVNPTIAAGDFKVSTDGGAFANLATLPVVTPAGGRSVKITLSAGEMNGDNIFVQCVDAAGAEWSDEAINIQTTPVDANLTQIDGLATSSNLATLNLKQLNVVNSAGTAIIATSTGGNGHGIAGTGNGTGNGLLGAGGASGNGAYVLGGVTSGHGLLAAAQTLGVGIAAVGVGSAQAGFQANGGTNAPGIISYGVGSGSGIVASAGVTGHGIDAYGGATSGVGIYAHAVGSGSGFQCSGASGGSGFFAYGNAAGSGILAQAGATGHGVNGVGGATSGSGFYANAVGSGAGITAIGVGGKSLLASEGISGPLDATERDAIALAALKLDHNGITGEPNYCTLNALRFNRHWAISGTVMTCYKENGSTAAWTANLTPSASADPVVGFASV